MNTADIYLITNLINGKQYVGQTVKGYLKRWEGHCSYAIHKYNGYVQRIDRSIAKYGINNFKIELLETVPIELKDEKEIYYIKKYNTYESGYNHTTGGDINPMFCEKTRVRHRQTMCSEEHKSKVSKSIKQRYEEHPELRVSISNKTKQRWNGWTEEQQVSCIQGFTNYNNSRKQKVAMITEDGNIIQEFECAGDACVYFRKT